MKKQVKILSIALIVLTVLLAISNVVLATDIPGKIDTIAKGNADANTDKVVNLGATIVTIMQTVGIVVAVVVLLIFMYKKVKAFRTLVQYIAMHLPLVGKLIIYNEMHLFAKTFSVLNKNNVLLTDSIDILSKITSNEFYKMIMYDTISNLLRGDKISLSFKDNWAVPTLAYYMISTGEATGELSEMLEKVSVYYEQEQRNLGNSLKTLIEPILMIILAVIVGGIMISIIVPMYDITKNIL